MNRVEFLPERIRQWRLRRSRLIRQGCLLGTCLLAMLVLTFVRHGRIAQARGELTVLEDRVGNVQRQVGMIEPLERQMVELMIKKRIESELGSRTDCTAVLAELCRLMPPNMAMISLDLKTVELRAEAAKSGPVTAMRPSDGSSPGSAAVVRRVRLVMTGLAPTDVDVANFIGQLSASPLFEEVNMGYTKTVNFSGRSGREFQASCYLLR